MAERKSRESGYGGVRFLWGFFGLVSGGSYESASRQEERVVNGSSSKIEQEFA